ncbi:MAG: hypothetical protein AAGA56_10090 [Myxococcota bacterium]
MRRDRAIAKRAAERREREDAADRLNAVVPELHRLKLRIEESRGDEAPPEISHTRHIVVARAPALFEVPCSDRYCDGHHNVTVEVVEALKSGATRFEGDDECQGTSRNGACRLVLRYVAEATYAA